MKLDAIPPASVASADELPRLKPRFLIIGVQKGGTTALYEFLSNHPGIAPPAKKEINFFLCPTRFALGPAYYHSHFPPCAEVDPEKSTFEASPAYLFRAEAAERIHSYNAQMKLIAILRDPVTRAYSAWQMYRRFYQRDQNWFFDWVRECDSNLSRDCYVRRRAFGESFEHDVEEDIQAVSRGQIVEMPLIRFGFYHNQLQVYLRHFPREQLFIESSERLLAEPGTVLCEIESFLGLDHFQRDADQLKPVFVGDYQRRISQPAIEMLKRAYDEPNRRLYAFLGRDLGWL